MRANRSVSEFVARRTNQLKGLKKALAGVSFATFLLMAVTYLVPSRPGSTYSTVLFIISLVVVGVLFVTVAAYLATLRSRNNHRKAATTSVADDSIG